MRKPAGKPAPKRRAAARKLAARPAVVEQKAQIKPVAKALAKKPAARKPVARKKPAPVAKTAIGKSAPKKTTPAPASGNRVVSMKDWVARYAALNIPDGIGPDAIGKGKVRK